jgi:amino acid adenylation domain-containing protein
MIDRSIEMIIGLLGILKSGGAYLPLNPRNPSSRTRYMLNDSGAKIVLTHHGYERELRGICQTCQTIDFKRWDLSFPGELTQFSSESVAYLIYTSGSTGNPRGVPIAHSNFSPLVHWGYRNMRISQTDRFIQNLSFFFDWSVWEIFLALTTGAGLYIAVEEVLLSREALAKFIVENKITVLHITPSQFYLLVGDEVNGNPIKLESLQYLCLGAERLTYDLVKHAIDIVPGDCRIYNMYGPTETTIISSVLEINRIVLDKYENVSSVPIGTPVGNTQFYVLDKYFNLSPLNVIGELYIGGDGLSGGYINNPELTADRFNRSHKTCINYKTGDLVRWLPQGVVEFLGRIDYQVKIRGYRIDLGEIENKLLDHGEVKAVIVIVRGETNLCAYVVPTEPAEPSEDERELIKELKEYLSYRLPGYMVPSFIMLLKSFPLTTNGKVDLRALPQPEAISKEEYIAPRNEVEEKLVKIWAGVLGEGIVEDHIGIDTDFFELGGHSLKATVLASRIYKELNTAVPLGEIFKAPTIRKLSEYIQNSKSNIPKEIHRGLVLLKKGSLEDRHLFLIHDGSGEVEGYLEFCQHLTLNFNYWGIRVDRQANLAPQNFTIRELAEKYISSMKKIQSRGPYYITGWSLGGTIAFEMAAQLEQTNDVIAFLALIDSPPPHKTLWSEAGEFTLESELNFIMKYSPASELIERAKKAASLNQLWLLVVDYLVANNYDVEGIKKTIVDYGVQSFPNFNHLDIKESIYYLNLGRTLYNARASYRPSEEIYTPVHYFAAGESKNFKKEYWKQYTGGDMTFYEIAGDHFSLFKMPAVITFAKKFTTILEYISNISSR